MSCERGSEPSGSIKCAQILDYLRNKKLLNDSASMEIVGQIAVRVFTAARSAPTSASVAARIVVCSCRTANCVLSFCD
jgi:hypothetical protein